MLLVDLAYENMPQNIVAATTGLKTFNLIPAVGLNVYSMLKHQTLVLTLQTLAFLEEKLLWHDSRYTPLYPFRLPYRDFPEPGSCALWGPIRHPLPGPLHARCLL